MQADFYINTSDTRKVNKISNLITTETCAPYGDIDIVNPQLIVKYNPALIHCNYIRIPEYHNRYYFARPTLQAGGKILFTCECDVLKTALQFMENKEVTAVRNENTPESLVEDGERVFSSESDISIYRLGGEFESGNIGLSDFACYALTLIG